MCVCCVTSLSSDSGRSCDPMPCLFDTVTETYHARTTTVARLVPLSESLSSNSDATMPDLVSLSSAGSTSMPDLMSLSSAGLTSIKTRRHEQEVYCAPDAIYNLSSFDNEEQYYAACRDDDDASPLPLGQMHDHADDRLQVTTVLSNFPRAPDAVPPLEDTSSLRRLRQFQIR